MAEKDYSQRFLFEESAVRGEFVQLQDSYQTILSKHDYPAVVQHLLGELLCATVMLSSLLKFEGHLSIHAKSEGPVTLLVAECDERGGVRAIAHVMPDACFSEQDDVRSLLPNGMLVISIQPAQGKAYQGIVPLSGATLAHCFENYFQQSEQLPTRFYLAADSSRAAGLMLQQLPSDASLEEQTMHDWAHLTILADTVRANELLALSVQDLLQRLFVEETLRLFEPKSVNFHCRCSREKTEFALAVMGATELEEILAEKSCVTVDCQFCATRYEFSRHDLEHVLRAGADKTSKHLLH